MKKTSKLFGAIALSATLAMGAIPAFAADTVGATEDIEGTEDRSEEHTSELQSQR